MIDGLNNFRDIGGYQTSSGQRIRTGAVYRSDSLCHLTKKGQEQFKNLKIKVIIDLRNNQERMHRPYRFSFPNSPEIRTVSFSDDDGLGLKTLYENIIKGNKKDFDFFEFMISEYRRYVVQHQKSISEIFAQLSEPNNYPLVVHCNAGKDRTGFVIAMILLYLGVSNKIVTDDYLLSKDYLKKYAKNTMIKLKIVSLFRVKAKQLEPLFDTSPEYLRASFKVIDKSYGSIEHYFDSLALHAGTRNGIRNNLLE